MGAQQLPPLGVLIFGPFTSYICTATPSALLHRRHIPQGVFYWCETLFRT